MKQNNPPPISEAEFSDLYREHLPHLRSFIYRTVTNTEDVEDLAQDTFVKAYRKLDTFEGRSGFKTWLFSIATNLVKDHHRAQKRWPINAQDNCSLSIKASPELEVETVTRYRNPELNRFEIKNHIDYCFTCVMKYLPLERQLAIMLADIYDFKVAEIAQILNKSTGVIKHLLHDGRNTMKDVFAKDCTLISKTGACWKCTEMSNTGNPKAETQKKIADLELARSAEDATQEQLYYLRTKLVKAIDPLTCSSFNLHDFLLHRTDYASDKVFPKTDKVCGE